MHQGSLPQAVRGVHHVRGELISGLDDPLDQPHEALLAGERKGRPQVQVPRGQVQVSLCQQKLPDVSAALLDGVDERRAAVVVGPGVDVGAGIEQGGDRGLVPCSTHYLDRIRHYSLSILLKREPDKREFWI